MAQVKAVIIGSGNIGTDLMIKVQRRSGLLDVVAMAGIDSGSDGLARAAACGVAVTASGDVLAYLDVIAAASDQDRPGIDADALLAEAIARFGPVPALRLLRIDRRWQAGDVGPVLDDLVALGAIDPRSAHPAVAVPSDALGAGAWDRVGAVRLALDDVEGATEAYRRSHELDPTPARRARLAVAQGRADRVAGARV